MPERYELSLCWIVLLVLIFSKSRSFEHNQSTPESLSSCNYHWQIAGLSATSIESFVAADVEDVITGVKFAVQHSLPLAVKGGGHSWVSCMKLQNQKVQYLRI